MLSETIITAIAEITQAQAEYPELYERFQTDIDEIVAALEQLRRRLDAPPVDVPAAALWLWL